MFRLKLFGSASIEGPDGPLTGRAAQRRRLALLALLAVARQRGLTRDKLIGYLWPDTDPERGRRLLSDSIYRVNQAVGGDALVAVGDELRLDPARLGSDVWEFLDALEVGDWRRAAELYTAPFLDGFFLTGADEMERWVDAEREALARDRARALEALATAAEQERQPDAAVRWWRVLATQDPYSSRVALRLMRALDASGERAEALRHARVHSLMLKAEMGLEPDAELQAFVDALRAGAPRAETAAAPRGTPAGVAPDRPPPAPKPSAPPGRAGARSPWAMAVLPFVNLSADPENEYFADGITEDVIAQLSKIGALTVISRASTMRFKGRDQSPREIGAALGATTLLGGSVRRAADRVRVVAQLVDADTGRCLWAETYDRRLTDVFAIQTDVALQIATALHAQLSPDERTRIRKEPTRDFTAYQLYLQGRHAFARYTTEAVRQAIGYYERAIARDPGLAPAHVGVALACAELSEIGGAEGEDLYRRATEAANRALELDPDLADAHTVLGLLAVHRFEWAAAEREFRRALELSPSSADAYNLFGRMCSSVGRHDESVAMQRRALELDPAHRSDFANALIRAGRYEEAVEAGERCLEVDPAYDRGHATLAWAYIMSGRMEDGLARLEHALALTPDSTLWLAQLGQAYAMAGRTEDAHEVLRRLQARAEKTYVSPYHLAYVYTGLGEEDAAIDHLERASREWAGWVYGIGGSFLFISLHSNPRFQALLRRINVSLPQAGH